MQWWRNSQNRGSGRRCGAEKVEIMEQKRIVLTPDKNVEFHNQADFCIGTGRMGLALHKEYFEQLKLVQKEIGFQYIRGHGLFCDDMAIFQTYEENGEQRLNITTPIWTG